MLENRGGDNVGKQRGLTMLENRGGSQITKITINK